MQVDHRHEQQRFRPGRRLFTAPTIRSIPETVSGIAGAANAFCAIGRHTAIGLSPFAIEDPQFPEDENRELARADSAPSKASRSTATARQET